MQDSVVLSKVSVKECSSEQFLLCAALYKAYRLALKFRLKCVHLTDERNVID